MNDLDDDKIEQKVEQLIERMQSDCKVGDEGHRNRFTKYRDLHIRIGLPSALLATAAGALSTVETTAGVELVKNLPSLPYVSLTITWLVALLTSASAFLRPYETSQAHREKTSSYSVILARIGRARAFELGDSLKNELKAIDEQIDALKMVEPILSDKRTRKIRALLEKETSPRSE